MRGKKIIVNQTLLSKLWYIGQICSIPKYTKKEYMILSETEKKKTITQTPSSTIHLDEWSRYFRHRDTIKLSKNEKNSKITKSHECSLEKSHAVSIELSSEL